MQSEQIKKILVGGSGAVASEAVQVAQTFDPAPITEGVGIITQIIILLATLVGLFKKKKVTQNQN